MRKISLIVFLSVFYFFNAFSQEGECTTLESSDPDPILSNLPESSASCVFDLSLVEIPGLDDTKIYTDLTVNMTFAIIQDANGNSSFNDDYQLDKAAMEAVMNNANGILKSSGLNPSIPNPSPTLKNGSPFTVSDPLIKFHVLDVIYIRVDQLTGTNILDIYEQDIPQSVKDVSLVTIMGDDATIFPGSNNTIAGGRNEGPTVYMTNYSASSHWFPALFIHEWGHAFGLDHTFGIDQWGNGDGIADTPIDIFAESAAACAPKPANCACPDVSPFPVPYNTTCPNNFMGYWNRGYFSPTQINTIRSSILFDYRYAARTGPSSTPLPNPTGWTYITADEHWSGLNVKGNVRVESGNTLTIEGFCYFGAGATIEVEGNATLILDCAWLMGLGDAWWNGIRLLGDHSKPQTPAHQGSLQMQNSSIRNAIDAIHNGDWQCPGGYSIPSGGIIDVSNSSFLYNARDVALVKYEDYSDPYGLVVKPYQANFTNVTFLKAVEGDLNVQREASVSLWGVQNVLFDNCEFTQQQADIDLQQALNKTAIFMQNASINLKNSTISNYNNGIRSYTTFKRFNYSTIENNLIRGTRFAIYADGDRNISKLEPRKPSRRKSIQYLSHNYQFTSPKSCRNRNKRQWACK